MPAAFGFLAAILGRTSRQRAARCCSSPRAARARRRAAAPMATASRLGLDPARVILVEAADDRQALWAMEEALRSGAPAAVAGAIGALDLKLSQRLHLAAGEAGPARAAAAGGPGTASAAVTRWRVGAAHAAHDRFGLIARWRWQVSARTLPQRTTGSVVSGVRSCHASFQSGCRAGRSGAFSQRRRATPAAAMTPV